MVRTERLYGDGLVALLYARTLEQAPRLYHFLTSKCVTGLLGALNYDSWVGARLTGTLRFLRANGARLEECVQPRAQLDTARKVFERKIRYWECRPLPTESHAVVSPADARVLVGSWRETSQLFVKEKFFRYEELLDPGKQAWVQVFAGGDFAILRLTPEKYHYNHTPVAGTVLDCYEIPGHYQSCNPYAVVQTVTPYSKNKRVVTIIDTDVPKGSRVGVVALIEIVALLVGDIVQCYSSERYETPRPVAPGMFVHKGLPKSLYRPGSSTTVLLFQSGRVQFAHDIVRNLFRQDVRSRFSQGFGRPLVETEVKVRSLIATAAPRPRPSRIARLGAAISTLRRKPLEVGR
jgi:phosphatidylserine decarboxylase